MLQELEKLFGFRTNEHTDIAAYLKKMDEMAKLDDLKQNKLIAVLIDHVIELESKISLLSQSDDSGLEKRIETLEGKDNTRELSTIKADITRIKKKVYSIK